MNDDGRTTTSRLVIEGRSVDATLERTGGDRFRLVVDGRPFAIEATPIDGKTWSLLLPDGSHHVAGVTETPAGVTVHLSSGDLAVTVPARRRTGRLRGPIEAAGTGGDRIVAPMPGRVVRLLVAAGQLVRAGQGVVVIEAMKMENELRAPRDGVVREVLAREGHTVEAGAVLVVIAEGSTGSSGAIASKGSIT